MREEGKELSRFQRDKVLDKEGEIANFLEEADKRYDGDFLRIKDPQELAKLKRTANFWSDHHQGRDTATDKRAELIKSLPDIEAEEEKEAA